jgi:hypothetical protein
MIWFPPLFLLWTSESWAMCFLASNFAIFSAVVLSLSSSFNTLWSVRMRGLFLLSYICWGLICSLKYNTFWRKFHELMRRIYIVLLSDEIFCRLQLGLFDLVCQMVPLGRGVKSTDIQISIDRYVVIPSIQLFLLFKDLIVYSWINATLWLLVFTSPVVWYSHSLVVLFTFVFCVQNSL